MLPFIFLPGPHVLSNRPPQPTHFIATRFSCSAEIKLKMRFHLVGGLNWGGQGPKNKKIENL